MSKSNQSYIYRIYKVDEEEKCYIGSSVKTFQQRMQNHFYDYKRYPERNLYKFIKESGGWDMFKYNILEVITCTTIRELRQKEQEWIEKLKPVLNIKVSYTGILFNGDYESYRKEYSKTDFGKKVNRTYYEKHKNEVTQRNIEYKSKHREHLLELQRKKYYDDIEKSRENSRNNAKKYLENNSYLVTCICGAEVKKTGLNKHLKTKNIKH